MTHWPKSFRDITYRIFLLRRLILVCAALIWTGMVVAQWVHAGNPDWPAPRLWAWVLLLGLLGPAVMVVLFPAGWIDNLAMALTASVCLMIWPSIQIYFDQDTGILLLLLAFFGPLLLVCGFMGAICLMHDRWPMGQLRTNQELELPASADAVMAHEFPAPDRQSGRRWTGRATAEGFFPVYFGFIFPDPVDWTIPDAPDNRAGPGDPDAYARVIERGPYHQVTQYLMCKTGSGETTGGSLVAHHEVIPIDGTCCRFRCQEVHDVWDFVTWVAAWLNDQSRDYVVELADDLRGVQTVAVRALPQITPIGLLAKAMTRWSLATPGADPDRF